jgi:hypothetical protein
MKSYLLKDNCLKDASIGGFVLSDNAMEELKEKIVGAKVFYETKWVGVVIGTQGENIIVEVDDDFDLFHTPSIELHGTTTNKIVDSVMFVDRVTLLKKENT